jgi:hypothetical protein
VPIGGSASLAVGDVLLWDHTKAPELFNALKNDQPVPAGLLTGS